MFLKFCANNAAVVHMGDAVAELKNPRIVRDDENRPVGPERFTAQNLHHEMSGLGIERRRWFVANQQSRIVNKRPRDRHALLLPTGKLPRERAHPGSQAHLFQQNFRFFHGGLALHSGGQQRNGRIFSRCERGQKIVLLKNETQIFPPEPHGVRPAE